MEDSQGNSLGSIYIFPPAYIYKYAFRNNRVYIYKYAQTTELTFGEIPSAEGPPGREAKLQVNVSFSPNFSRVHKNLKTNSNASFMFSAKSNLLASLNLKLSALRFEAGQLDKSLLCQKVKV